MLVVYCKLTQMLANKYFVGVTKWFKDHPRRKVCRCEFFTVRRAHIAEDIMGASLNGVKLPPKKKGTTK